MDWNTRLCILVYSAVLIQCVATMTVTYIKVKRTEAVTMLLINEMLIVLWLVFGMHEIQSVNDAQLNFAVRLTLLPISLSGGTWLIFALLYAEIISFKNIKIISMIMLPEVLLYLPALTNKYYDLIVVYKSYSDPSVTVWGLFSNINFNLSYIYITAGIIIILVKSFLASKTMKKKVFYIIIGPALSLTISLLQRYSFFKDPGFDLTPVTFSFFALFLSIAIFRFNAFGVVRNAAMEMLNESDDAILILDRKGNIVDYNRAAKKYFTFLVGGLDTNLHGIFEGLKQMVRDIEPLQKIYDEIQKYKDFDEYNLAVVNLKDMKYFYSVSKKSVFNKEDEIDGTIIKISNRTSQSIEVIKEERIRISEDLHDSISNMINVVSMNLEFAMANLDEKKDVEICIDRAYEASKRIRVSLRQILDELSPFNLSDVGIINALESLFKRIIGIGIQIDFTYLGIEDSVNYNEKYGEVIYKVCVEALNNALFNGKATSVAVVLRFQDGHIKVLISDNGAGCEKVVKGRGLIGMENRLTSLGGQLMYDSVLGEGFTLLVELPYPE